MEFKEAIAVELHTQPHRVRIERGGAGGDELARFEFDPDLYPDPPELPTLALPNVGTVTGLGVALAGQVAHIKVTVVGPIIGPGRSEPAEGETIFKFSYAGPFTIWWPAECKLTTN